MLIIKCLKKSTIVIALLLACNTSFAACDPGTDPFCEIDVDDPIDSGVLLLTTAVAGLGYYTMRKKLEKTSGAVTLKPVLKTA